jgi:hypothetical protein
MLVEQWFAEFTVSEAATEALDMLALRVGITFGDAANPFRRHVACNVIIHLHQNEATVAAVLGILFQHCVRRGAVAPEGVEDERIFISSDLQDALDQSSGFWCVKRRIKANNFVNFFLGFLVVTTILISPPRPCFNTTCFT